MSLLRPVCGHCRAVVAASGVFPSTSRCQHALYSSTARTAQEGRSSWQERKQTQNTARDRQDNHQRVHPRYSDRSRDRQSYSRGQGQGRPAFGAAPSRQNFAPNDAPPMRGGDRFNRQESDRGTQRPFGFNQGRVEQRADPVSTFGLRRPNQSPAQTFGNQVPRPARLAGGGAQSFPEAVAREAPPSTSTLNPKFEDDESDVLDVRRRGDKGKGPSKPGFSGRERRRDGDSEGPRRIRTLPEALQDKVQYINPGKTERQLMEVRKQEREAAAARRAAEEAEKEQQVIIPSTVTVGRLAGLFGMRLPKMLVKMRELQFASEKLIAGHILTSEEACEIAIDFGFDPIVDDEKAFDLLEESEAADGTLHPLRPPVVTIMGHVDHGKTTLLDALRNTAVAAGEAGGITQHIGAFSVPLTSLMKGKVDPHASISFLDTPGHAAFTAMRARGASVTDIIVLVVAADDGVMPQTKEVIELWKAEQEKVGLVVAINKVDKRGTDIERVKRELMAEGIYLEEDGGEVPSVHVSGLAKLGLDNLVETLHTVAEIREIRSRQVGKAEGYVLESRVDKGQGSMTTILVTRGVVKPNTCIVAGSSWGRVRQMQNDQGRSVKKATPGMPISIAGWRDLPEAGDQFLEAVEGEEIAKKVVRNRIRAEETRKLLADTEHINAKRRADRIKHDASKAEMRALVEKGASRGAAQREVNRKEAEGLASAAKTDTEDQFKELRLIIKGDVSGSVEAVEQVLSVIGNKEAGVKVIMTGVGDINDSDIDMAQVCEAQLIGFNVNCSSSARKYAEENGVKIMMESIIYRLIETVRKDTAALLPPTTEARIIGESTVLQTFDISLGKRKTAKIAGVRVNNGVISRKDKVRVIRGEDRTIVFEGTMNTLKHVKKDVDEMRKGSECGIGIEGFEDIQVNDEIVTFQSYEIPRTLD